ncbi:MAG: metallophosphoesterase, partial [Ramlibacter sp.]|nr:metallophosphoesterase [Ramlibacter sp.]
MSLIKILALSAALHLYIAARLASALPSTAAAVVLILLLLVSSVLIPAGLMARRFAHGAAADRLTWVGMLFMGLFSSLIVLTFFRDVALTVVAIAGADVPWLAPDTATAVPLMALGLSLVGLFNARRTAKVKTVDIPLAGLDPALEGFRIVQISDIHVGPTIKHGYLEAIVDRVNALHPDVIAITGDLVDGSVPELAAHVSPLARLQARHGFFFVTGNHEYYSGVHGWV